MFVVVFGVVELFRNFLLGIWCKGCEFCFIMFLDFWNLSGGWKFFLVILDFCLLCCWDCNILSVIKIICDFGLWYFVYFVRNECVRDW